jgi:hypothetical protein
VDFDFVLNFRKTGYFAIAPIGQTLAHAPHSTHFAGSIQNLPSLGEIATTGQTPAHVPHPTHFIGSILYAIFIPFCRSSIAIHRSRMRTTDYDQR